MLSTLCLIALLAPPPAMATELPPPPIVNGSSTNAYEPVCAMVAADSSYWYGSFCSCTLINRYYAVTAAHCVEAINSDYRGYDIYVVFGGDLWNGTWLDYNLVSEAIAHMAEVLETRAEYISTFASGVSHEFKTPLTSIRGAVELLRDHLVEMTPEERNRFLDNLEQDADRLDRLVNRLTDLARADVVRPGAGITPLAPVLSALAERFRHHGVDLKLTSDGDLADVAMEREVLESILINLLDNARLHGGPRVQIAAKHSDRPDLISVTITDNGAGISAGNARRIFDRFFTTARDRGGSGLGLSIVRTLVEGHGGTISVESEPGRTTFEVRLPTVDETRSVG